MEYSRKITADGAAVSTGPADSRVMDFGSVFLVKAEGDDAPAPASSAPGSQPAGVNVAELVVARGFGTVIRHRDFEERSNYYDALLSAESREEVSNGSAVDNNKQKEVLKVVVTEVLGSGGKFYVQTAGDQKIASIQQQLASLSIQEAPVIGAFNPKKGDIVLAQFSADNSWNRAMIVNAPRGAVESPKDKFEVFYIDYGNQEVVPYSELRPLDPSVSSAPGLAQLCSLAYVKVPSLEEDFGQEAAEYLSEHTLNSEFRAMVEEKDLSGGKVKGQGTGPVLVVTLVAVDAEISVNAAMLQEGLARLEKQKKRETKERKTAIENLEKFQEEARADRRGMWRYGDIQSDDEDIAPPVRKAAGKR
ncbi:hypothetical protein GBA52_017103 [Prunus armeniaca]|nr:hypothetical protein GBA52_017103 [Prunus armeniaca]